MYLLLVILMLIASVLMCFIVLIQNSKGGGLASGFSSSNQIMGVRKTTDFLEKATWTLAAVMVVFSIVSAYTIPSSTGKGGDVILEQAQQEEKTNPYNMPVGTEAPQSEAPAATTPAEAPAPAAHAAALLASAAVVHRFHPEILCRYPRLQTNPVCRSCWRR